MSSADMPVPARRRLLSSLRSGRPLQVAAAALVVLVILIVLALVYGDLPELLHVSGRAMRNFYNRNTFLPGFALLYLEESGVPLPAPGDVFVMYVGAHVPPYLGSWVLAWLGLIGVVVLGATNPFFIARSFGRRLAEGRFAHLVHLSPER